MRLVCDPPLFPGWLVHSFDPPELSGVFIVKGTFRLRPGAPAEAVEEPDPVTGDLHEGDDPSKSLRYASDFSPFKPHTDLLLAGSCHTPGGKPLTVCGVTFQVGSWSKRLAVIGDRVRRKGVMGYTMPDPEPFTRCRIGWDNTYGGPDYKLNPIGTGRAKETLADGTTAIRMPNVEYPSRIVQSSSGIGTPASYAPIPETWSPRRKRALKSSFGSEWLKTRWPWLPRGFDWGYFNSAPEDQQLTADLKGDEELFFENLHPDHPNYVSALPTVRPRCFLGETFDGAYSFREAPLRLDTLWADPEAEKLVLVWRGRVPVRSLKLHELEHLYLAVERMKDPAGSPEHHRKILESRLPQPFVFEPPEPTPPEPPSEEEAELEARMDTLEERAKEMEAQVLDNLRAKNAELAAAGLPTHPLPLFDAGIVPDPAEVAKRIRAAYEGMKIQIGGPMPPLELSHLEAPERVEEEEEPESPPWTRQGVLLGIREGVDFAGQDLGGLDLSHLDFTGARFAHARLTGANLSCSELRGVDLRGADLRRADLSAGVFEGADLRGANLTKATAAGTAFRACGIEDADFTEAGLEGADFEGATGFAPCFNKARLAGARFVRCELPSVDFTESDLTEADFREAKLVGGRFEEAKAPRAILEGADLTRLHASDGPDFTGANFRNVRAEGSSWEGAILDGADFSNAALTRATFMNASLKGALLFRAEATKGRFDEAKLAGARLRESNFCHANFERADLSEADLRGSNFYNAEFWDAVTRDALLQDANLKSTKLSR